MRTREVWIHAVDLDNGGSVQDFPPELHDLLLEDLVRVWRRKRATDHRNLILEPSDRAQTYRVLEEGDPHSLVVKGIAAELVAWGIGRSFAGVVTADGDPAPHPPQ